MTVNYPTSKLPSIKSISSCPFEELNDALKYLRSIYHPPVLGSRRSQSGKPLSSISKKDHLEDLKNDSFEKAYSIKWLTSMIAQLDGIENQDPNSTSIPESSTLVESAASLLAICAGAASAGTLKRRFVFQVLGLPEYLINIDITDVPLDNHDYGSVGAQTWGGACVLSEMIAFEPEIFCLPSLHHSSFRCLELGAGTGLVSLTVAKVIGVTALNVMERNVDIVATDYYPSVLINLGNNIRENCELSLPSGIRISFTHLDWSKFADSDSDDDPHLNEPFDVVYGADIIYESQHATWIKSCLAKLLKKPSSRSPDHPVFHLIIPLRSTHAFESNTIEQIFKIDSEIRRPIMNEGIELVIKYKEIIVCDGATGKDEEIEYAYYRIGWGWS